MPIGTWNDLPWKKIIIPSGELSLITDWLVQHLYNTDKASNNYWSSMVKVIVSMVTGVDSECPAQPDDRNPGGGDRIPGGRLRQR